jgi:molybdopterin synthase sulfur carrier subunit
MAKVWIPSLLQDLTAGNQVVTVPGSTVAEIVAQLEQTYPGIRGRLCEGEGLRPGIAVAIDTQVARSGLMAPVTESSEVHFLPAIGGGQ